MITKITIVPKIVPMQYFGCMITAANHSYTRIRKSKECVINIPTVDLSNEVVSNCSGVDVDKFSTFHLTTESASKVVYTRMLSTYNFVILEVVKAHVAVAPKYPKTLHYRSDGIFMASGDTT